MASLVIENFPSHIVLPSAKEKFDFLHRCTNTRGYFKIQNVKTGKFLTADYEGTDPTCQNEFRTQAEIIGENASSQKWRSFYEYKTDKYRKTLESEDHMFSINAIAKSEDKVRKGSEFILLDKQGDGYFTMKDVYKMAYIADTNSDGIVQFVTDNAEIADPKAKLWKFVRIDWTPLEFK